VVEEGKAVLKIVETGLSDDTYIEITSGLAENDRVIVGPYRNLEKLKQGKNVKIENGKDTDKKEGTSDGAVQVQVE
jgi:HlyD family secretion protein